MIVELAYGTSGVAVDLPDDADVVRPRHQVAAPDPAVALRQALRQPVAGEPLRRLVRPGQSIAISICDVTRPQPREAMLQAILAELEGIADPADVTVLVATGTHRGTSAAELDQMIGPELAARLHVVDHDCADESALQWCGVLGDGVPVWLNRAWLAADVRITTGFVEPHFFAGFSGGPKLVAPGLAGLETVLTLHDARRIGDPRATWGVCTGNPVHDDVRAIAAATGVTFALDVVLDHRQQVVQAFGGELFAMHAAARQVVRAGSMRAVDAAYDVVVTSNAGYPLDQNLYQAVKGMSAAASVVRPGGLIVAAAECRDGFPDHGSFRSELEAAASPAALSAQIAGRTRTEPDQWQLQILAGILGRARVGLHADGLTPDQVAGAHLLPVDDIGAVVADECARIALQEKRSARVCVLPEGPQTIPYVARVAQPV